MTIVLAPASHHSALDMFNGRACAFLGSCVELATEPDDHETSYRCWAGIGVDGVVLCDSACCVSTASCQSVL